ncbi:glutamate racemase [Aliivibrio fischeri MJ11]|uniref:Glutamate racemase n=1 Tax=Aliivibrio fischeri (strain MJ11) TaxID=388396 RepID=MURI_ALIFM|nr:glutamate racemase [Aliivibrio fischeri]B5FCA3.1 RecName: Full=Glutamate racemase [Aliivibrio fischeri MJ11]ACH67390.1 glutamate racemase [Aliivibrio fischeri MJ11]
MPKHILIFDSGIGGLSVYKEIKYQLPLAKYIYAFDNAAFPYGELTESVLIERTTHIISELCSQFPIDIVVIACNTASTVVLPSLRDKLDIPVVGVVPAIKPAALVSNKIGLLATPATVKRSYTYDLIKSFAPISDVQLLGSTRLVEMAEEKMIGIDVDMRAKRDLSPWQNKVDTIVLGCTHFPFLKNEIKKALGNKILLIDSGEAIARRVKQLLNGDGVESAVLFEGEVFCSAPSIKEEALNHTFKELNFSSLQCLGYPKF